MTLTHSIMIDWDGDGVAETDEAGRTVSVRSIRRGRRRQFAAKRYGRPDIGKAVYILDNFDGRFDELNTSSPLYPDVQDGRLFSHTVNDGSSTYNMFTGFISNIAATPGSQHAIITVEDGWKWLERRVQRPADTNIRTGEAIKRILEGVNWPEPSWQLGIMGASELGETTFLSTGTVANWSWGKDLDAGDDTIPFWWTPGFTAARQILDLADSESGFFYIAANGQAVFRERSSFYAQSPDVVVTQSQLLRDMAVGSSSDTRRNRIFVSYAPVTQAATTDIWTEASEIGISPGLTLTIEADYNGIAIDVISPVATTDYTMFSETSGGGVDLTANLTVSLVSGSSSGTLTITNTGAIFGFINLLKIRGDRLSRGDLDTATSIDTTSENSATPLELSLDFLWQQAPNSAINYADWIKSWAGGKTVAPRVRIQARPSLQFAHDLGAIINADIAQLRVDENYRLGYIEHRSVPSANQGAMQLFETIWHLERFDFGTFWSLGDVGFSELGETTLLGY